MAYGFRAGLFVLLAAGLATAAPIPCVNDTLSAYLALPSGGCLTTDGYSFADFTYAVLSGPQVNPSAILVTPLAQGLILSSQAWTVTGTQSAAYAIGFTFDPPVKPSNDIEQTMSTGTSGSGSTGSTGQLCVGSAFAPPGSSVCPGLPSLISTATPVLTASKTFPPNKTIGVLNTLHLDANGGTATLISLRQEFRSDVPEPATALITAAVVGWFLTRRRLSAVRSSRTISS